MKKILMGAIAALGVVWAGDAAAFCGFYVAKADTTLFNEASQVVMVRDGDRTIMTMSNDFKGDVKDFAMVIPVPSVISKSQIHITERKYIERVDAFTSPRLVEYFDEDPCQVYEYEEDYAMAPAAEGAGGDYDGRGAERAKSLGITIEASYTVGEYDILILSAKQSDGLETWLREEGYKPPKGASQVLKGYIKQKMKFFVAKVNLKEQSKTGYTYLRPIQVAYESPKFMLPIRLGTVNAKGSQELFVYALTRTGRVETTNYRTVKLPSGNEIPPYVKDEFSDFYKDMFARQVDKENNKAVFLEYAWDMGWCDPCAADPLTAEELGGLGVWWMNDRSAAGGQNVFVSRLHVRYDGNHFPEDLTFQETGDRTNFQGRYVLRHPFTGAATCEAANSYFEQLAERQETEAQTLATLTGWDINKIRKKAKVGKIKVPDGKKWWERLWGE